MKTPYILLLIFGFALPCAVYGQDASGDNHSSGNYGHKRGKSAPPEQKSSTDDIKHDDEAQAGAVEWLSHLDTGNFAEGWKSTSAYFQKNVQQTKFEQLASELRHPLGKFLSRKLKRTINTKSPSGLPNGEYVVLQFDTSFVNKKTAVETVTMVLETGGDWKVSEYYIK